MDEIELISVRAAIEKAEQALPGKPAETGLDPRWQAIIAVGEHVETEPEAIWEFIRKWGCHPDEDLQSAVACSLLEHLLEHHFSLIFPRVEELALSNDVFAETFLGCWAFGQSEEPLNSAKFNSLRKRLGVHSPAIGASET